jgi:hypothetical protein
VSAGCHGSAYSQACVFRVNGGKHGGRCTASPSTGFQHMISARTHYPPAIAPMIQNGSAPEATACGNGESGES